MIREPGSAAGDSIVAFEDPFDLSAVLAEVLAAYDTELARDARDEIMRTLSGAATTLSQAVREEVATAQSEFAEVAQRRKDEASTNLRQLLIETVQDTHRQGLPVVTEAVWHDVLRRFCPLFPIC